MAITYYDMQGDPISYNEFKTLKFLLQPNKDILWLINAEPTAPIQGVNVFLDSNGDEVTE